ncbi:putative ribonuclease H protein [Camellia lanceoleosa]|uniref:Ribonuclease H protein n=1 Tax=Camellia lanceoleosa TaxID=1840588 RepID=A0ACC0FJN0_9ERIC|nr:putative ribonuclease H protein [Camellia lanceoleosa]
MEEVILVEKIFQNEGLHIGVPQWVSPPTDWVKLNVDGASVVTYDASTVGGLIHASDGGWKLGFQHYIGIVHSVTVELWAIRELLNRDWCCDIVYNPREVNKCADYLAKAALTSRPCNLILRSASRAVSDLLQHDAQAIGPVVPVLS